MKKICLFIILVLLSSHTTYSKNNATNNVCVYAIPGLNNVGVEDDYVQMCLSDKDNTAHVTRIESPIVRIDLGQKHCQNYLKQALEKDDTDDIIIYATSQGTATALNYLANVDCNHNQKIKALVLESVLISGNDAIQHTVSDQMGCAFVKKIPSYYYWLPYAAKLLYPFYSPAGQQVITSLQNIPNDIPIIIIHADNDFQLSYEGACALYYGLRTNGNNNVYLITKHTRQHLYLLNKRPDLQKDVRNILKHHNLLTSSTREQTGQAAPYDFTAHQPNPDDFQNTYNIILNRETWHTRLWYTMFIGGISGAVGLACYIGKKLGIVDKIFSTDSF